MRARPIWRIVFFAIFTIWSLLPRLASAADPTSQPATGLDLLITDPDGKPLSGAQVTANIDGKSTKSVTHADGHVQIPPPKQATSAFTVSVHVDGLVDKSADWRNRRADPIPPTYTMKLEAGTTIRGKVLDDAGQPIAGATVVLWISKQTTNARERYYRDTTVQTGADGNWSLNGVPPEGARVEVGVWDYSYATSDFFELKEPTVAELRDGSFTLSLMRGVPADCTVLKPDGTPMVGARIAIGGGMASNRVPPQKTNKDGLVTYNIKPGGQVVLTITAAGYATELTQFMMGTDRHAVSVQLTQSTPITGRVVDPDGKPVPGAWVYPDTWRGFRSLDVRIHADRNGKFIWKDPPTDEVLCDVEAGGAGFLRSQGIAMTTGGPDIVVTLQRSLHVRGTVIDADTNQPIPSFKVIRGISFEKNRPTDWQRDNGQQTPPGRNGIFQFDETFPYPGYAVRIEADGYTPAESRVYSTDEKQVSLEFKLIKGKALTLTVLSPDGKPAAGTKVLLLEPGRNIQVNAGLQTYDRESPQATADADGHCTFPAESGPFKVVALSEAGYAQIPSTDVLKSGEVHLKAWAVIQGTLMKGSKPWPGQVISGSLVEDRSSRRPDDSTIYFQLNATSSPDGTFTIKQVPAGAVSIGRQIQKQVGQFYMNQVSDSQQLDVSAGQTSNIRLGGKGRPVEGQITLPTSLANRHDWMWDIQSQARTKSTMSPTLPMPADVAKGPVDQRQKWITDFMKTDAGKAFLADQRAANKPGYPLEIADDGKFRIEDVPPGTYVLTASVLIPSPQYGGFNPEGPLGTSTAEFTIAEIPGGQSDDPLKLPPVTLTMIPHADIGDVAPDFTAKTDDGKNVKLSDFKGKYVLIDFFYPQPNGERGDQAILSSVADTFAGESRLTMLGVNLGGPPDTTKSYGQPNGLSWTATSLPPAGQEAIKTYRLRTVTSIWLISPDGKIIGKNLTADIVKSSLNTALGPQGL